MRPLPTLGMFAAGGLGVLALGVLGVSACEPDLPLATDADEPDIWAAALAFQREVHPDEDAQVFDTSCEAITAPYDGAALIELLPELDERTIASFEARAFVRDVLRPRALPAGFVLVAEAEAPAPQPDRPHVRLSRAGLGPDEALVYLDRVCGEGFCAEGLLLIMARVDGAWTVLDVVQIWVA